MRIPVQSEQVDKIVCGSKNCSSSLLMLLDMKYLPWGLSAVK